MTSYDWNRFVLVLLILVPLCLGGLGWAQNPPANPSSAEVQWWTEPRLAERLDLTAGQSKAIEQIVFASEQRMIDLRAALEKARLDLGRLLTAETIDEKTARVVLQKMDDAECAMARERSRTRLEVALVLNREQRLRLTSFLGRRQERRMQGRPGPR